MLLGLKIPLRWLHPLCRPYTRTCPTLAARAAQSDGTKSKLVDLANKKHQGKIEGDHDAATKHVEQTPAKRYHRWSDDELRKLEEMVRTGLRSTKPPALWEEIGRQLGRSARSCSIAYYAYAKKQIKAGLLDPKLYNVEAIQKAASAIERHRQDADSKGVVAIDWQAVARETGKPMLDILNQISSLIMLSKSDDAASAAQTRAQMLIPYIHTQRLQYPQEWLPSHVGRLQQLLDDNRHQRKSINIQVVSLYMGIEQASCALALNQLYRKIDSVGIMDSVKPWTAAEKERLKKAVKACGKPMDWKRVSAMVGTRSEIACCDQWYRNIRKEVPNEKIAWTAEEIAHITEMIQNSPPGTVLLPTICKMYPDRSHGDIKRLLRRCRDNVTHEQMYKQLRENPELLDQCVDEMRNAEGNVDWSAVGKKMGVRPSRCKRHYENRMSKKTSPVNWSMAEVDRLQWAIKEYKRRKDENPQGALRGSVDWHFVSMMVGSRTVNQCINKYLKLVEAGVLEK
ncbi:hypothetical protein LPJ75_001026 [Coemansia sp. RSA 2598]|nr:hypothetical protein LPJ75_001026 [Coemansia sp. RSA 2598]